jgi:hypothetical protein
MWVPVQVEAVAATGNQDQKRQLARLPVLLGAGSATATAGYVPRKRPASPT